MVDDINLSKVLFPANTRHFFEGVSTDIAAGDAMFGGNHDHYFSVGASALSNILVALEVTEQAPDRILDFGCGAGRVTRWLRSAFPAAAIEGCDIREADIQFVADAFGARTWISGTDVGILKAPTSYDLIWVGSVFTHLSMDVAIQLFDKLTSWLNPEGVLVFTSHGRKVSTLGEISGFYGVREHWSNVLNDYDKLRYGYADYATTPGYGISVTQLSWWADLIAARNNLRLVSLTEYAWDNHQDVIGVQARSQ